jgi:hypothetical protein
MKTLKFVTITAVVVGAAVIVGLYLVVVAAGTASKAVTAQHRACEPIICMNVPSAATTVIAEQ